MCRSRFGALCVIVRDRKKARFPKWVHMYHSGKKRKKKKSSMLFRSSQKSYLHLEILLLHCTWTRQECKIKGHWLFSMNQVGVTTEESCVPLCLPCGSAEQRPILDASPRSSLPLKHVKSSAKPNKTVGKKWGFREPVVRLFLWAIIPKSVQG